MKSFSFRHAFLVGGLAIGVAGLLLPGVGWAEGKGASKLMKVSNASSLGQGQNRAANKPAMTCPRCKDALVTVADQPAKGMRAASVRTVALHQCPACSTRITTSGAGKAKADKVEHSCAMSAGANSSCCMAAK